MEAPVIARKGPFPVELDPGTYWWCACGRSKDQPFCDGSHKGTGFLPVKLEIHEKTRIALCGCKHTHKPPYCDGTHESLT
jgi:CDGSH-type Zn-finger protein